MRYVPLVLLQGLLNPFIYSLSWSQETIYGVSMTAPPGASVMSLPVKRKYNIKQTVTGGEVARSYSHDLFYTSHHVR